MLRDDGHNLFEHECEQQRAAEGEDDIMCAKPGEEDIGLFVAHEVLDGEDGGEIPSHGGDHDGSRGEGRDTGLPGREVVRERWKREGRAREDHVCKSHVCC